MLTLMGYPQQSCFLVKNAYSPFRQNQALANYLRLSTLWPLGEGQWKHAVSKLVNTQDRLTWVGIKQKYLEIFCISEERKSFALTFQHQPILFWQNWNFVFFTTHLLEHIKHSLFYIWSHSGPLILPTSIYGLWTPQCGLWANYLDGASPLTHEFSFLHSSLQQYLYNTIYLHILHQKIKCCASLPNLSPVGEFSHPELSRPGFSPPRKSSPTLDQLPSRCQAASK